MDADSKMALLIVLAICLNLISEVQGTTRFVSSFGTDENDCITHDSSCSTLSKAFSTITSGTDDEVTIYLDNSEASNWLCQVDAVTLTSHVAFVGFHRHVRFGCDVSLATGNGSRLLVFNINGRNHTEPIRVRLSRLTVTKVLFEVYNCAIEMDEVILEGTEWRVLNANPHFRLTMFDSIWQLVPTSTYVLEWHNNIDINIFAHTLTLHLLNVVLRHAKFNIVVVKNADVRIENCTFTSMPNYREIHGGIYLRIQHRGNLSSEVIIRNTSFEQQFNSDPVSGIRNIFEAALMVKVDSTSKSRVTLTIDRCRFADNERGLTLMGQFIRVDVTGCKFEDNIAMHAGAGILFLTDNATLVNVVASNFTGNQAGYFRPDVVNNYTKTFQVEAGGNEVKIDSTCCKGLVAFLGKGGAVRVQRGKVSLKDCSFQRNLARLLGGAVYVDREAELSVDNVLFENSHLGSHSLEGDVFYSNGLVFIHSATIKVLTASNHVAIVHHSGTRWSIEITQITIHCPVGYRLRVTNASAYGVTTSGLKRSYKLDQLSYFCESCPRNKYSLEFGSLNYTMLNTELTHFVLMVNGQEPDPPLYHVYIHRDIVCLQCPYGGKCQDHISAVANFWGYESGSRIKFQHCPKGYCCSSADCDGYSKCAPHRTGALCGRCEQGYSEALFSSGCVPDDLCDSTLLWPVMIGSGILYFLFLLFQKDIRDLMFLSGVRLPNMNCCSNCSKKKVLSSAPESHELHSYREGKITEDRILASCKCVENFEFSQSDGSLPDRETMWSAVTDKNVAYLPDNGNVSSPASKGIAAPVAVDVGASFLIIIFFYFQDAQLLHIKTVFTSVDNKYKAIFRDVLAGLFKFRIEIFQFFDQYCFLRNVTPTKKLLFRALFIPYVLLQFASVYLLHGWVQRVYSSRRQKSNNDDPPAAPSQPLTPQAVPFSSRLATGFVLSLLFVYQKLATTSFILLNCVPVENRSVLFIDGTIDCYQNWQYGVMAYAASCIVPFCLVLLIGPGLLKDSLISLLEFFFACMLPLPFLVRWFYIRASIYHRNQSRGSNGKTVTAESKAVIQILQGPFKDIEFEFLGSVCGQGLLIGRRLILVLLYTFVNDNLIRMLGIMLFCFLVLLHHVHTLPYKDKRGNLAGSFSAAALVMIGSINLVRAGFEAAEYIPHGPNATLMSVFDEIENALILWLPGAVMAFTIACLLYKLNIMLLCRIFRI